MPPKNVQQIKADIEARRQPVTPPTPTHAQHPPQQQQHHHLHLPHFHLHRHFHRSHSTPPAIQTTNAAMSAKASPTPSKASLNSVRDTSESSKVKPQPPARPSAATRPSWIGPKAADRPVTPGLYAMPQTITLRYASPGLKPPVFVFTSLSEPQWEPVEMDKHKNEKGEWTFTKSFSAEPGDYQYKYRLGPGDWWALDEKKPTVDDGFGNKNNLMVVKEPVSQEKETHAPLMPHEALPLPALSSTDIPAVAPGKKADDHIDHIVPDDTAPLMPHEEPTFENDPDVPWNGDGEDEEPHNSPLLRHESLSPNSAEQFHSPLFRHETIALGEHKDDHLPEITPTSSSDLAPHVAPEAEAHDLSLERFPSDHNGILEHIHRFSTLLPADETTEESIGSPISEFSENGNKTSPMTSLPSVEEDEEDDSEDRQVGIETKKEDLTSMAPMTPPMTPKEEEQIAEDIVAGLAAGESVDEAIERAVEAEIIREEIAQITAEAKSEDEQELAQKLVPVTMDRKTILEIMTSPAVCLAIAGIALVVGVAGFYVAKGDISSLLQSDK